ncbi:hypothetical protein BJY52DRAFT_1230104 [Lactarius psammicola]|nr:hypothetical protein BJY52DRAFT_1230104 [Lactarius psammicola]
MCGYLTTVFTSPPVTGGFSFTYELILCSAITFAMILERNTGILLGNLKTSSIGWAGAVAGAVDDSCDPPDTDLRRMSVSEADECRQVWTTVNNRGGVWRSVDEGV